MNIDELVKFSNFYGGNTDLVLAGGGNTSAKNGNVMYVKSSGTRLATIKAEQFAEIDLTKLSQIFEKEYPQDDREREALVLADLMASKRDENDNKRPSVETMLHALFKQTYVLHLHPAVVNGLTCSFGGEKLAKTLFGEKIIWVDACKPGYILSKICYEKISDYEKQYSESADILFLQNHGVFIADNTVEGLGIKLNSIIDTLEKHLVKKPDVFNESNEDEFCKDINSLFGGCCVAVKSGDIDRLCENYQSALSIINPFTPDHIVYCNAYPLWIENAGQLEEKTEEYKSRFNKLPKVIICKNKGIYCVAPDENKLETVKAVFEDAVKIAVYSQSFGGALNMSENLTDFIVNWEVESYRSKQS